MTIQEFLTALRETPREWYLSGKMIRAMREGRTPFDKQPACCPITGVDGWRSAGVWRDSGVRLALPTMLASDIAAAADGSESCDPALRAQLLAACDLQEVQ